MKNVTFYSVSNTLYKSLIKISCVKDPRSSLFTRRILLFKTFLTRSTNNLLKICDCKCKVFTFYTKNFTFYSVLNTLYQSLIKNLRVKDARPSLFTQRILHFTSFLSTLYQSLIKNLRVKDVRVSLYTRRVLHFTAFYTRSTFH